MRIVWRPAAITDRQEIFRHIAADSLQAAVMIDLRIEAAVDRLADFPESGRPGRVEGTRELVLANAPYVLPYQIIGEAVRILRVLHSARLWPDEFGGE